MKTDLKLDKYELDHIAGLLKEHLAINSFDEFCDIVEDADENVIQENYNFSKDKFKSELKIVMGNIVRNNSESNRVYERMSGSGAGPMMGGCAGSMMRGMMKESYDKSVKVLIKAVKCIMKPKTDL